MPWIRNRPFGLVHHDPKQSFPGYTLFCTVRGHYANLLDWEGRIVHRWHHPDGIQHARLIDNGNLLIQTHQPKDAGGAEQIGGSASALIELDWESNVVWEYRDDYQHHDYYRLPNGNHLLLKWRPMPGEACERVRGGHHWHEDPERMWGDLVAEISPAGETVREWLSWEHLSFEEDVICPLESRKEWTHANSISLTPEGDWLMSFRLTSTVAIVDQHTGKVKWRFGPGEFSHQHAPTWLESGKILVFDNGCHRLRGPSFSRVVEVDPATNEIGWQYMGETILGFYSFMISGANRLPNGNTLITEGASGRLFEVTPERETVWEYVSPFVLGSRFGASPAVFRAHRYGFDDPRIPAGVVSPDRYADLTRRAQARELEQGAEE
jgi:hypothetical protein